ncbi:peptidase S8/S53 domain-containing protein [Paraphysoderma sedebokerense]|nr:peptidase S8/S53 domain-containing protein [Paraphysoderma sedebokerense]
MKKFYIILSVTNFLIQQIYAGILHRRDVSLGKYHIELTSVPLPTNDTFRYLDILDGKLDFTYTYPSSAGDGVDIYILDTGILTNHTYFGSRAKMIKNFVEGQPDTDLQGHGTHVAGIAAMVARKANIFGIKVVGHQFATEQIKRNGRPSVINMSIGSNVVMPAVEQAMKQAASLGIPVIRGAGNEGVDACQLTLSDEPAVIVVGNSNSNNTRSPRSNYGTCVDIFAQGTEIFSASPLDVNGSRNLTGTSMSSPLVAGITSILLSMGAPSNDLLNQLRQISNTMLKPTPPDRFDHKVASLELLVSRNQGK